MVGKRGRYVCLSLWRIHTDLIEWETRSEVCERTCANMDSGNVVVVLIISWGGSWTRGFAVLSAELGRV